MSGTIRPARFPQDLSAVRGLFVEYVEGLGLDLAHQDVDGELADLPGKYVPPQGAFLVADLEGHPAGIGALRPLPDGSAELKRMYLRPDARGSGLGRRMAETLIAAARAAGYARIRLDTQRDMAAALALYRALGFVEIPRYNDNPLPGAMFMALDLAAEGPGT